MLSDIFTKLANQASDVESQFANWTAEKNQQAADLKAQVEAWKVSAGAKHQEHLAAIRSSVDGLSESAKEQWNQMTDKRDAKIAELKVWRDERRAEAAKHDAQVEADWAEAIAADAIFWAAVAQDEAAAATAYAIESRAVASELAESNS